MTKQLQPQKLDIKITKITNKTVYYELTANEQEEKWSIPDSTTFDKSTLEVGVRYQVLSRVIRVKMFDFTTRKHIQKDRYDWVSAVRVPPKARLAARTCVQRKMTEAIAATQSACDDSLFIW